MNISCEPYGIVVVKHPKQGLGDIAGAGFGNILLDMTMACPAEELEDMERTNAVEMAEYMKAFRGRMKPFLEQCAQMQLQCSIAMAPCLSRNMKSDGLNDMLRQLTEESIKMTGQCGGKYLIVRPLSAGIEEADLWNRNREYYLHLADYARKYDVRILLENQCKSMNGHLVRGICSDGVEAAEWVDELNRAVGEERFGFCMDIGVCNLCGQNMYDFILELGNRLKAVILRDCDENSESARLPFTGVRRGQSKTDWLNLIRGLRETGFDQELIMDFGDTAAAVSPLLRSELLRFAKSIAEYFRWQIEMESMLRKYPVRVLFGAGNMCRNYMKCYGEKYPPLYTCDNNDSLWGTVFCGLEVKSPNCLKNLPEDCVIFICNIYYREIEEQLRKMRIWNPIEYFSDEYMPSFYFDRLERANKEE